VQIPTFPESNHSIVKALNHYSDQDLLTLFQRHPDQGQYFVALFCRYCSMVYTLIRHSARSPVQADYLFASTWRHVFHELGGLDLRSLSTQSGVAVTLQSWLINVTAICINQSNLPPVESIHYTLGEAPPPLWCYVERALGQLPPDLRIMVLMAQTFGWSETRISAYLQAEGEFIAPAEVKVRLQEGYQLLQATVPSDIQEIYMEQNPLRVEADAEVRVS